MCFLSACFRCSVIWRIVRRSRSIIARAVASTLAVHSARLSFTSVTYATCIYCHTSTRALPVLCVIMESFGPIGRRWGNITSRSMPRQWWIRSLHSVMICLIDSRHSGQLKSLSYIVYKNHLFCWRHYISCFFIHLNHVGSTWKQKA